MQWTNDDRTVGRRWIVAMRFANYTTPSSHGIRGRLHVTHARTSSYPLPVKIPRVLASLSLSRGGLLQLKLNARARFLLTTRGAFITEVSVWHGVTPVIFSYNLLGRPSAACRRSWLSLRVTADARSRAQKEEKRGKKRKSKSQESRTARRRLSRFRASDMHYANSPRMQSRGWIYRRAGVIRAVVTSRNRPEVLLKAARPLVYHPIPRCDTCYSSSSRSESGVNSTP